MSDLITRTARLVPYAKRPKQVPSFVTAYSYEPLAGDVGAELGNLYVVMEVLVSGRASEEVADLIIETIGEKYYNDPDTSKEPLARFEAAIKAANQELGEHVNRGNAAWIGKLSSVVAVQVNNELHVAQTGSAEAFLYRGKAVTHITPPGSDRPATPTKTFGSIATGQLEAGDRLLLATPALIHQVPLKRLQHVISETSPNNAIAEITHLLHGASTERIAALVIETTTPELAALQIRPEEPDEIQLGTPETPLEAAKMVAAPIAQTTVESGKKFVSVAHHGIRRVQPHAKAISLAVVDKIRQILSTKTGRRNTLIGIGLLIITIIGFSWYQQTNSKSAKVFSDYQSIYQTFVRGDELLSDGNKTEARDIFQNLGRQLEELKPKESLINNKLKHATLPENEPRTFAGFRALIADRLDQIEGLVKIDPINVAAFNAKNAKPNQFQLVGNNAYVIDPGTSTIIIVNITSGSTKTSAVNLGKIGNVVSTTISGANDGLYLLTDKPSVWFYRFDNDTITEQSIAFGTWPKATAIASYTSNLYLLGDTTLYKHAKNATGYSPKTDYLNLTNRDETKGATALAIDGAVYVLSPTGLHRFVAGALKQSAPVPSALSSSKDLHISTTGDTITTANPTEKRIGLWVLKGETLTFSRQIAPNNIKALYSAVYDNKTSSIYALADNRLVRLTIKP